jgi:hypothetical protein
MSRRNVVDGYLVDSDGNKIFPLNDLTIKERHISNSPVTFEFVTQEPNRGTTLTAYNKAVTKVKDAIAGCGTITEDIAVNAGSELIAANNTAKVGRLPIRYERQKETESLIEQLSGCAGWTVITGFTATINGDPIGGTYYIEEGQSLTLVCDTTTPDTAIKTLTGVSTKTEVAEIVSVDGVTTINAKSVGEAKIIIYHVTDNSIQETIRIFVKNSKLGNKLT